MRTWIKPVLVTGLLAAPLLSSCLLSPVGDNISPVLYPEVEGNVIKLTYKPTSEEVAVVKFKVFDHDEVTIKDDDSPDDDFVAEIDVSKLAPGVYTVEAREDDNEDDPNGTMTLLVPGTGGGTDGGSSDAATPKPDGGATDAAASS